MLRATWKGGSLRFWIAIGMALSIVPLLISAILVYAILNRGVISGFQDVAARQRDQLVPLHQLQLILWEASDRLELYLDDGDPNDAKAYRASREQIEAGFLRVRGALANEQELREVADRARVDWTDADRAATSLMALRWAPGEAAGIALAKQVENSVAAAIDKLSAASARIMADVDRDHTEALFAYERSEWVTGIAGALSLLLTTAGVLLIGRLLIQSVDRLVDGAERFAAGDRDHRIEIQVPPELHRVAEEFNRMIVRIRDDEATLADLARRDRLTGLLNRRAFDEAMSALQIQRRRRDEGVALLVLDLDHFKQINDTFGHGAGDAVLRAVAGGIASSVRSDDQAFRIGGEEFAVLLHMVDAGIAVMKAERFRAAIAELSIAVAEKDLSVTVSIGVATLDASAGPDELMKAADAALYQAKREGRNRVVCR